ncbi:MAG TPA: hypothetical protein DCM28_21145 [Phycisphaerales bacterium]|nr:hypothetical protein [Phycisphaerales bacterium]HCD31312.1 hypothetical protein [Phycisphaerales bacterium]|tara:strand:+ start:1574 stop:2755 length:1182 start_codon:yes stop_codon:yes gene_type:complete
MAMTTKPNTPIKLADVAHKAQVSIATASLVLSNSDSKRFTPETQQRVLSVARELGYTPRRRKTVAGKPADSTSTRQPRGPVSVFMGTRSHVYGLIVNHLVQILQPHGYAVQPVSQFFRNTQLKQFEPIIASWKHTPPSAVVLQYVIPGLAQMIDDHLPKHVRRVAVCRSNVVTPDHWPTIDMDMNNGGRMIADHLLKLGHKRIGIVTHQRPHQPYHQRPELHKSNVYSTPFILGIGHAMRDAGIRHGMTIHYNERHIDITSQEQINIFAQWLSQPNRPSAIVGQDYRLVAVRQAALQVGLKIPEDLTLIGLGNTPWSQVLKFPSLSMHEQLIARHIGLMVTAPQWQFDNASHHIRLQMKLVDRNKPEASNDDAIEQDPMQNDELYGASASTFL